MVLPAQCTCLHKENYGTRDKDIKRTKVEDVKKEGRILEFLNTFLAISSNEFHVSHTHYEM